MARARLPPPQSLPPRPGRGLSWGKDSPRGGNQGSRDAVSPKEEAVAGHLRRPRRVSSVGHKLSRAEARFLVLGKGAGKQVPRREIRIQKARRAGSR